MLFIFVILFDYADVCHETNAYEYMLQIIVLMMTNLFRSVDFTFSYKEKEYIYTHFFILLIGNSLIDRTCRMMTS